MDRVIIKNLVKIFNREYNGGFFSKFLSFGKRFNRFKVLDGISFNVKEGERVGIIGKNGSGKSTLLRTIAGIYNPDYGLIRVKGSVFYLNGFGYGLNMRLSMRENIYLIGVLLGMSKKEITTIFQEIVNFSGLEKYLDNKVYQFSTGMITRLSFSITIHCLIDRNPRILLIDEVLNAGADEEFRIKAHKKIKKLVKLGSSVILISHNINQIKNYCDRVILIDRGKIVMEGDPEKVVKYYLESQGNNI
jgi:ABC-type polysaccharide/polyol phosphate transport system ATPase subunit